MKLCKCNNCEGIFEDLNPQINAKEYPDKAGIEPLKQFEDEGGFFFGCPNCETDGYLVDL